MTCTHTIVSPRHQEHPQVPPETPSCPKIVQEVLEVDKMFREAFGATVFLSVLSG